MNRRQRLSRVLLVGIVAGALVGALSCQSPWRIRGGIGWGGPSLASILEQVLREMYPGEELSFRACCGQLFELLHGGARPVETRLYELRFTYPRDSFPTALPDGVWLVERKQQQPSDPIFLRIPIMHENRMDESGRIPSVGVLARQRSDVADRLVGECRILAEVAFDRPDGESVEYRLIEVRISGTYDEAAEAWLVEATYGESAGSPEQRIEPCLCDGGFK